MSDFLTMMRLAEMRDEYLVKSQNLDYLRLIEYKGDNTRLLEFQCWNLRREAYKMLAQVYDTTDDRVLTARAADFGWTLSQLASPHLRSWLCKDAADPHDPNPVEAEHVYVQMAKNFPPAAIAWVKRAHWIGPIEVPWDRIDTDSKDSWAASHQPDKVKEFQKMIVAHDNHVAPSVIVQESHGGKAFIVDGHHRALAHENLKQDVLSYLGTIAPEDREAALETHTKQVHQGNDPQNA